MEEMIMRIAFILLECLIPVGIGVLVKLVYDKIGTERVRKYAKELEAKEALAIMAVRATEQIYYDIKGPAKLEKAMSWMIEQCGKAGLSFTKNEIQGLIEYALRLIKDELGEEWAAIKPTSVRT